MMTEDEWLKRHQLVAMLTHVHRAGCSNRKLQLAAVAFCRHLTHLPLPTEWHDAVAGFEEWIEGTATAEQVIAARRRLEAVTDPSLARDESGLLAFERFYGQRAATFLIYTGLDRPPLIGTLFEVKTVAWNANMVFGAG